MPPFWFKRFCCHRLVLETLEIFCGAMKSQLGRPSRFAGLLVLACPVRAGQAIDGGELVLPLWKSNNPNKSVRRRFGALCSKYQRQPAHETGEINEKRWQWQC